MVRNAKSALRSKIRSVEDTESARYGNIVVIPALFVKPSFV